MSKSKRLILALLLLVVSSFLCRDAFAGAWTLPQYKVWGEWYMKWHWANRDYGADSNLRGKKDELNYDARNWGWVMEPKLEYGVTDWLTFMASIEYKEAWYKEYNRPPAWGPFSHRNNGVTNVKLGGRMRFLQRPVVFSIQGKAFIYPGYGNYGGTGGASDSYIHQPGIGTGEDAFELRFLFGKEFKIPLLATDLALKSYAGFETGYRWKNRDVCNDIPLFAEFGFWPLKWLLIKTEVDGYINHDGTGSMEKSYMIWRVGPVLQILGGDAVVKQRKMFNVEFQYGRTFWGKNTSADQELVLKLQTEF